jgi:hypothetical protein
VSDAAENKAIFGGPSLGRRKYGYNNGHASLFSLFLSSRAQPLSSARRQSRQRAASFPARARRQPPPAFLRARPPPASAASGRRPARRVPPPAAAFPARALPRPPPRQASPARCRCPDEPQPRSPLPARQPRPGRPTPPAPLAVATGSYHVLHRRVTIHRLFFRILFHILGGLYLIPRRN